MSAPPDAAADAAPVTRALPAISFCAIDATSFDASFTTSSGGSWVSYACATACADWTACVADATDPAGKPIVSARDNATPMRELAFVVDGMGGRLVFTPDGDKTVLFHAGDGGTALDRALADALVAQTSARAVIVSWERGWTGLFDGLGSGWFTPKDDQPTDVATQSARVAAVMKWTHDALAGGNAFGTAACSMGTVATFGAVMWNGIDAIVDYQMLIGGPAMWDVNAGCGRVHYASGSCDVDASPCAGNPASVAGQSDPACPGNDPTDLCRVPETMINPNYDLLFATLLQTDQCAPVSPDQRDPALDTSSMMTLPPSAWSLTSHTDFVADEGAGAPDDERAGEGHALEIFHAIQGSKSWFDDDGAHHCDSFDDPAKIPTTVARIRAGMGL